MLELDCDRAAGAWAPLAAWEDAANGAVRAAFRGAGVAGLLENDAPLVGVSLRLSDAAELRTLNASWRGKDRPTNILSFPMLERDAARALTDGLPATGFLLGDMVVAEEVLLAESAEKGVPVAHHFCHLIVHGTLHLLGYDHIIDSDAEEMETLERRILAGMGIPDPYRMRAA